MSEASTNTAALFNDDLRSVPFSDRLQKFYTDLLEIPWQSEFPNSIFIRDYETLPESAPFDVDLMMAEVYWDPLVQRWDDLARQNGLVSITKKLPNALLILLFDPRKSEGRRLWAYHEVRKELPLTEEVVLTAEDLEIRYLDNMPVPSEPWRFLLLLHQCLRKNKLRQACPELRRLLGGDPECVELCTSYLAASPEEIHSVLSEPDQASKWRKKFRILEPVEKIDYPLFARTILKRRLMRTFYVIHMGRPLLYTLHGPDGVGKSTVCAEVADILSAYPIPFAMFHHITGWKKRPPPLVNPSSGESQNADKSSNRVSLWRRFLRLTYRNLPEIFRRAWVLSSGYHHYSKNLNRCIQEHFVSGAIMLCDRYIYDIWTKEQLEMRPGHPLGILHFLHCGAIRRPELAFVLTDEPEAIYRRKKELSLEDIRRYQEYMDKTLVRLGVRARTIPIASRPAAEVASGLVESLLRDVGEELVNLLRSEATKVKRTRLSRAAAA